MIPEELSISGFYSYQETQTIYFNKLFEDKMFGIFGNVGSGKSSILEAITLALYGETERLSQADGRNYNIMNLRSNNLNIRFIFRANNKKYKFEVIGTRNQNNRERVMLKYKQFIEENNSWLPMKVDAIEILGLSYENFKRTIIIPQGKFQEFLTLSPRDRTNMMKELFCLERFDLSDKAEKHYQNVLAQLQPVQGQLAEIGNPTQEEITSLEEELKKLQLKIHELTLRQKKLQSKVNEQELLASSIQKIQDAEEKLKILHSQAQEIKDLENELLEWDIYRETFLETYLNYKSYQNRIFELIQIIQELERKLKELKKQQSKIRSEFEKKEKRMQKRDHYSKRREEWLALKDYIAYKNDLDKKEKKLQNIKLQLESLEKKFETLKKELENKTKILSQLLEQQNQLTDLLSKKMLLSEKFTNSQNYEKLRLEIENYTKDFQLTKTKLEKKTKSLHPNLAHNVLSLTIIEQIKEEILNLEKKLEKSQILFSIQSLSKDLEIGDICPLCGEIIQSKSYIEKNLQNQNDLIQLKTQIENLKSIYEQIQLIQREYEVENKNYNSRIDDLNLRLKELKRNLLTETEKQELESIETKLNSLQNSKVQLKKLQIELENQEREIKQHELKLQEIQKIYFELNSQYSVLLGKIQSLRESISQEVFDKGGKFPLERITERIQLQTSILEKIPIEFQEALERKNQFEKDLSTLENFIIERSKETEDSKSVAQRLKSELEKLFLKYPEFSFEKLNELSQKNLNSSSLREKIQNYFREIESLQSIIKHEKEEISSIPNELSNLPNIKLELEQVSQTLTQDLEQSGKLHTNLERLRDLISRKKELEEIKNFLQNKLDRINTLQSLFRGQGFVNYISRIFLEDLCESANERFFVFTKNRLRLELNENGEIQVRDYINNGNLRHIKTLSGGQMFQASLAMALALSDRIQKSAGIQESFFFLDEGFGSLDKESLQIVFETLKSLRKENRIVGLISHVEEMKSEIRNYILVENLEQGSVIKQRHYITD